MSLPQDCRHWTTPRWLSCIYERMLQPFLVKIDGSIPISGDISVSNFPTYKLPPYTKRTFVTTDGSITQINYFEGETQIARRDLTYSSGAIATDTLTIL